MLVVTWDLLCLEDDMEGFGNVMVSQGYGMLILWYGLVPL